MLMLPKQSNSERSCSWAHQGTSRTHPSRFYQELDATWSASWVVRFDPYLGEGAMKATVIVIKLCV